MVKRLDICLFKSFTKTEFQPGSNENSKLQQKTPMIFSKEFFAENIFRGNEVIKTQIKFCW